jgi:hypothetical protein
MCSIGQGDVCALLWHCAAHGAARHPLGARPSICISFDSREELGGNVEVALSLFGPRGAALMVTDQ